MLEIDRWVLSKYLAKAASTTKPDGVVNFKALRVGEMYLLRAEAYAKSPVPNYAAAMADLNDLRAARIFGYVPQVLVGQPCWMPLNWNAVKSSWLKVIASSI